MQLVFEIENSIRVDYSVSWNNLSFDTNSANDYLVNSSVEAIRAAFSDSYEAMIASSELLNKEWNSPEEDAAWDHL